MRENGTFICDNQACKAPLYDDPVIMITTFHIRRFCTVECIIEGYQAHMEELVPGFKYRLPDE